MKENRGKGARIKEHIGRYKIERGMLRIIQEMEKPKNLICLIHGHELMGGGGLLEGWGISLREAKQEKLGQL